MSASPRDKPADEAIQEFLVAVEQYESLCQDRNHDRDNLTSGDGENLLKINPFEQSEVIINMCRTMRIEVEDLLRLRSRAGFVNLLSEFGRQVDTIRSFHESQEQGDVRPSEDSTPGSPTGGVSDDDSAKGGSENHTNPPGGAHGTKPLESADVNEPPPEGSAGGMNSSEANSDGTRWRF